MTAINKDYKNKIFLGIKKMSDCEIKSLDVNNPGYQKLVEVIKEIIDKKIDVKYGFNVEFNQDYSKIKKIDLPA